MYFYSPILMALVILSSFAANAAELSCTQDGNPVYTEEQKKEREIEDSSTLHLSPDFSVNTECPSHISIEAKGSASSSNLIYQNTAHDNDPTLGVVCTYRSLFTGRTIRCAKE